MSSRDVRRALLRAALLSLLAAALVLAWAALRARPPALALLVTALSSGGVMVPLTWVEAVGRRKAAAGRPYVVFAPAWALGTAAVVTLVAEFAYVDALVAGRGVDASLADALERTRLAASSLVPPLPFLLLGWAAVPVGGASSMRVRGADSYAAGLFAMVSVGAPLLCVAPLVFGAFVLVAPALLAVDALADRLERRWRRWRDGEPIAALRARLARGEDAPERVRLLAYLGDEVACGALDRPDPDDCAPDPEAWAKGLLSAGPRLVARAALAAARTALPALDPERAARGERALREAEEALTAPARDQHEASRAPDAVRAWEVEFDPAWWAVTEAVHAATERRPLCGIDAIRTAILATGDVELVRAAIRAAVEPHLDELPGPPAT